MIITRLQKHQKYLLEQCLNKGNRIALWGGRKEEAGIGKSLVALAYAQAVRAKRVLVTCDRQNIDRTWPVEVKVHTDFVLGFPEKGSHYITSEETTVSLVSHDWLKYHVSQVSALGPFDLWIGDESADYKNPRTLRMKMLRKVIQPIKRRMIMSAFPVSERLEDIFGQVLCLDDGKLLGEYITHFRKLFMLPDLTSSGYGWVPTANAVEQIRGILRPYVVGLPPDMQPDMPKKKYQTIYVDLPDSVKPAYNELNREFRLTLQGNDSSLVLAHASVKFMKLFELCNGFVYLDDENIYGPLTKKDWFAFPCNKIPIVKGLVERYPGKSVVWSRFIAEQDFLSKELDVPCWIYRGGKKGLDPFKQHKGRGCLLISCQYAKGLNDLVDCHNVIHYSLPWAYITKAQADGRTCRLTGKGVTNYTHIVVRDTVDERIYNLVNAKGEFVLSVDGFRSMVD